MKKKWNTLIVGCLMLIAIVVGFFWYCHFNERSNEDYINVFTENRQDFEYVAKVMEKWTSGSIDFDDGISSANREIEKEISDNEDFNKSLTNLYALKEISYILIEDDEITFYFSKFPKDYHGGISYGKNLKEKFGTILIDDDWALKMLPNV